MIGTNVTLVAIPYQIYRDSHSSLLVGIASIVQLPLLIAGSLIGGAYGDRFDKRRLLLWGCAASAAVDGALGMNAQSGGRHYLLLVFLAAVLAGVAGFTGPIRSAALPIILGEDDLIAGYSLHQVVFNISLVLGPSVAGLILSQLSLGACYFIDALTFGWLALVTYLLAPLPSSSVAAPAALFRAIRESFSYVRSHPIATTVWFADLNAMVFGMPRALFPAMAATVYHGGAATLGLLYSSIGVGAVVCALFTGWVERVQQRGRAVVLAIVVFGAAITGLGIVHRLWFGLLMLAIAGGMDVISTVLRNTILQLAIRDEFRSRLSAMQLAVVTGGPRLGDIESGTVAALVSTEFSIVTGGLACIAGVLYLAWRRPTFWHERIS